MLSFQILNPIRIESVIINRFNPTTCPHNQETGNSTLATPGLPINYPIALTWHRHSPQQVRQQLRITCITHLPFRNET